ncbi:hypothetical protein FB567DRAFT_611839 [Paraphoma chrysanthemicola]|uniref:NAD(P)-binding protein n=1 Tax=Paraphoma chrysanthemicola TaxID=798071 RepID=A0A8K0QWQ4_9PLEO|nr:hypothetical protein FB567DRAFT_611839 [Paraphoma chrysanthemicola]
MNTKSIVFITGGNTGIGYESVKALYASPQQHIILMGSRSLDKAAVAISTLKSEVPESESRVVPIQIDIESDDSIEAAYTRVSTEFGRIDTLINNAGAAFDTPTSTLPLREAWSATFSLNITSTHVFTTAFIPLLLLSPTPRLLFITSGLSSLHTASAGRTSKSAPSAAVAGWPKPRAPHMLAYRSSKCALNMVMLEWKRILEPDGVKVFGIGPGFLATGLGGMGREYMASVGAGEASVGGEFVKRVVEGERDGDEGRVIGKDGVQEW